jgi:hypothetical protein
MKKILAISALSLALAGSAFAQTTSSTGQTALTPDGWKGPIAEAFFDDQSQAKLRGEDEFMTNWGKLTPEQQAVVKTDCEQGPPGGGGGMKLSEAAQEACNRINKN